MPIAPTGRCPSRTWAMGELGTWKGSHDWDPGIVITDAAYGVLSAGDSGRYATALPSNLTAASSWDAQTACDYGAQVGREVRDLGFNMTLGGGVDVTRDPRNGRTFQYAGEDPPLAGTVVGHLMKCDRHCRSSGLRQGGRLRLGKAARSSSKDWRTLRLRRCGAGVLEVVESDADRTYRAAYTVNSEKLSLSSIAFKGRAKAVLQRQRRTWRLLVACFVLSRLTWPRLLFLAAVSLQNTLSIFTGLLSEEVTRVGGCTRCCSVLCWWFTAPA